MMRESGRRAIPIVNSAWEPEEDRFTPRANLIEAVVVFATIEFSIWGLIARPVDAAAAPLVVGLGYVLLTGCLAHIVLISPALHADRATDWGLPAGFARHRPRLTAIGGAGMRAGLALTLALLLIQGWPNLLARLGVRRHLPQVFDVLTENIGGYTLGVILAGALLLPLVCAFTRGDNLASAARVLAPVTLLCWGGVAVWAGCRGLDGTAGVPVSLVDAIWPDPDRASVAFYWIWALVQQTLFLAYFNVRLRRAIRPRGFAGLPGRGWVALLCGGIFCVLHVPNGPLMVGTFGLGAGLGWVLQVDRTRHLVLAALSHATTASLYAALVPLSMDVGPWP